MTRQPELTIELTMDLEQQVVASATSTKPHYPALMLWIESPYETGGTVWVDSISVVS